MQKTYLLLVPLFITVLCCFAEEYTIERILELVKDCSDDIAVAELEYAAGMEDVKFYQAEAMPQISFSTGLSYINMSMKSQSLTANETMKLFERIDGASLSWNLNLHQPLITFGRVFNALKIARVRREMLVDVRDYKKDFYYLSVINAFSKVYLEQERVSVAMKSLSHAEKMLKRIEIDLLSGNGIRRDSLRLQALVYGISAQLQTAVSNRDIALQRMQKLTELTMPLETEMEYDTLGWASEIPEKREAARSLSYKIKENEALILKYNSEYEQGNLLPTLSLIGNISNEYMIPDTSGLSKKYIDYLQQTGQTVTGDFSSIDMPKYSDYFDPDFFNYSIGLQLTWNIFDGRRSYARYHQAQRNFEKADRELKIIREESEDAVAEAYSILGVLSQTRKWSPIPQGL